MDERQREFERALLSLVTEAAAAAGESDEVWTARTRRAADRALANPDLRRAVAAVGRRPMPASRTPPTCRTARLRMAEAVGLDGRAPAVTDLPDDVAVHLATCADCERYRSGLGDPVDADVEAVIRREVARAPGIDKTARPADAPLRRAVGAVADALRGLVVVGTRPQFLRASGEQDGWSIPLATAREGVPSEAPAADIELRVGQVGDEDVTLSLRPTGWPAPPATYRFRVRAEPGPSIDATTTGALGLAPWASAGDDAIVEFSPALVVGEVTIAAPGRALRKEEQEALLSALGRVVVEQAP